MMWRMVMVVALLVTNAMWAHPATTSTLNVATQIERSRSGTSQDANAQYVFM